MAEQRPVRISDQAADRYSGGKLPYPDRFPKDVARMLYSGQRSQRYAVNGEQIGVPAQGVEVE